MYQDKSCYRDKVNRAAGQRTGVMVFAGVTYKLHHDMKPSAPSTGTPPSRPLCLDEKLRVIYRDWAKTTPPRRRRQLTKPPGRYSAFEARDGPQINLDKRTITQVYFNN